MRTCRKCRESKADELFPLSGFRKDGLTRKGDGRRVICQACVSASKQARIDGWSASKRAAYLDAMRKRTRAWQQKKPHHYRAHHANLQAQRRGADGLVTAADVQSAWERWGGVCWCCGEAATQVDHFRPINKQAGGKNTAGNIRPICADCNHKRSHRWHGEDIAAREAVLLKQLKELLK